MTELIAALVGAVVGGLVALASSFAMWWYQQMRATYVAGNLAIFVLGEMRSEVLHVMRGVKEEMSRVPEHAPLWMRIRAINFKPNEALRLDFAGIAPLFVKDVGVLSRLSFAQRAHVDFLATLKDHAEIHLDVQERMHGFGIDQSMPLSASDINAIADRVGAHRVAQLAELANYIWEEGPKRVHDYQVIGDEATARLRAHFKRWKCLGFGKVLSLKSASRQEQ